MVFKDINTEQDLISYLNDVSERLNKRKYIYHYTTVQKCAKIFISKKWHLCNAKCMNDQLEYRNGDSDRWKNVFFASFMSDADESIGMWSMYGSPWEDGVQIAIPVKEARDWIKEVSCIEEISCRDFRPTGNKIECDSNNRVFLSSVIYSNCDNPAGEDDKITWSTVENKNFPNASHNKLLTGYVKDSAWDYEKEIRIKAVFNNEAGYSRVAIGIPDTVLDSFVITASPLFKGSLKSRLEEEIKRHFNTDKSLFSDRFRLESACNLCERRQ